MIQNVVDIVTTKPDWHTQKLAVALHGMNIQARVIDLQNSGMLQRDLPARRSDKGTWLQRCFLIRYLRTTSIDKLLSCDYTSSDTPPVIPLIINSITAIARSCNKAETSAKLKTASVSTPDFWVAANATVAREIIARETASGASLVLKPLRGSQGFGLRLLDGRLPYELAYEEQPYYLQRFVASGERRSYQDYRVFVIGGHAVAGMTRSNSSWICNVAQGAQCLPLNLAEDVKAIAEESANALGLDYAGVDVIRAVNGELYALEVNAMPAWRALQDVSKIDIARSIARHIVARINDAASLDSLAHASTGSHANMTITPTRDNIQESSNEDN